MKKGTVKLRHSAAEVVLKMLAPTTAATMVRLNKMWEECRRMEPIRDYGVRPFTLAVKEGLKGYPLTGVEIGLGFGLNAKNILATLNIRRLYCVDPLRKYVQKGEMLEHYVNDPKGESVRGEVLADPRVRFLNMTSDVAFRLLPTDLDFVYIDGNHEFEFVQRDLYNAFAHVRKGGYVGGHDFSAFEWGGVVEAVIRVAHYRGKPALVKYPDFWFVV